MPVSFSPKYLWFLMLCYCMFLSLSNFLDSAPISIFGFTVTFGAIIYPLTFVFADIITYVYGYKFTIVSILSALLFNILFIASGYFVAFHLADTALVDKEALQLVLKLDYWVILASFVSYLVSEPLNGILVARIKIKFKDNIALAFLTSTLIASSVDSVLFSYLAFRHTNDNNFIFEMMIHILAIKVAVELIALPFSIRITKKLIKSELLAKLFSLIATPLKLV